MSEGDAVRALALALLPHLRELGAIDPLASTEVYDREHLPPGYASGEAFSGECRRLGLDRVVYREGRSWRVPSAVWHEARRLDRERRRGPRPTAAPVDGIDGIDAQLAKAGLRLVRGRT